MPRFESNKLLAFADALTAVIHTPQNMNTFTICLLCICYVCAMYVYVWQCVFEFLNRIRCALINSSNLTVNILMTILFAAQAHKHAHTLACTNLHFVKVNFRVFYAIV